MEWLEISVAVEHETAEAVAEVLSRYAHRGVVIESGPGGWNAGPVVVRAYLPAEDDVWAKRQDVEEAIWHLGQIRPIPDPTFRPIAEEDWTQVWKDRLEVLHVGQHIVIQPSWLDYAPAAEDVVIQLDPGMAFGTGLHPTTQMCLVALEELVRPGMDVLDMGTGSGILAIAAAKLGAGCVLAVDNSSEAVQIARDNVTVNGVRDSVRLRSGTLSDVSDDYDLVVVNILARVIIEMAGEGLAERLRPDGVLIAAGIIADQASDVIEALGQGNLALVDRRQRGDWVNFVARRA